MFWHKGGVVLAESTVMLLSLGKLRRLTPDACSPKLRESVASKSGELQEKGLESYKIPTPPWEVNKPRFCCSGKMGIAIPTSKQCYDNVHGKPTFRA